MDKLKIGQYIAFLRKEQGLTQKELAEKLHISFQAVSKWENAESLPDTGLLLELCDILNTSADKLLHGGCVALSERRLLRLEDVIQGFQCMENIGKLFGENSTFYTGMVEGINQSMNLDLLTMLKDPRQREVLYAEVLIQGLLSGYRVDMEEIEAGLRNKKMVETIGKYRGKTE
ncbi:MAG: helix-turn-helix transcriptional regulator [Lachnospiraceae bacterium]|nr:helix-turn-helix transcriptional regulator [Lachnospiraceae bacterium]